MDKSLSEVHGSIEIKKWGFRKSLMAFAGPAFLISVGYMDPGNWATDIAWWSGFGYTLIWVLVLSNLMALTLQYLCAKLGIVAGRDLAQINRTFYPKGANFALWVLAELAIVACDLAEVLGMTIWLNLLFGIPLLRGIAITILDTFVILALQKAGMRKIEAFILTLVGTIWVCFGIELFYAHASLSGVLSGLVPHIVNDQALYIAIGIIGATVMPHNLYLHSALVQSRKIEDTEEGKRKALKYNTVDSAVALNIALFVNAAILIVAAAVFYKNGLYEVTEIQEAHRLLAPLMGASAASTIFAIALILSGQSSTITGTLAGQVIMEWYLNFRIRPWLRRLITRLLAILPSALVIIFLGESYVGDLMIISQVVLSMQLGFAIIPLIHATANSELMGKFRNKLRLTFWACTIALIVVGLNIKFVINYLSEYAATDGMAGKLADYLFIPLAVLLLLLLVFVVAYPLFRSRKNNTSIIPHEQNLRLETSEVKSLDTILLALDLSESDSRAVNLALHYGGKKAHYVLLHAVETVGALVFADQTKDSETLIDTKSLDSYVKQLEVQWYRASALIAYGNPAQAILNGVVDSGADLLVMAQHKHKGLQDVVLWETINSVRHDLNIPLLIA